MNQEISANISNPDKRLHPEQFDQVVEAILAGKYSWACVLMLRFVGYNPMHYIPYRTYNRLLKENSRQNKSGSQSNENSKVSQLNPDKKPETNLASNCLSTIKDLAYQEAGNQAKTSVNVNKQEQWLTQARSKSQPTKQVCEFI
ncbi:MAG TPA: HetP family heterocyst commitment protein [Nostocaceae cyanobacterium]|nr:HetP family heterocyst commitment protein [Nostocaceae cyanobacterium]